MSSPARSVTRAPGEVSLQYERPVHRKEDERTPWSPASRSAARLADHAPWTPIRPA